MTMRDFFRAHFLLAQKTVLSALPFHFIPALRERLAAALQSLAQKRLFIYPTQSNSRRRLSWQMKPFLRPPHRVTTCMYSQCRIRP